MKERRAAIHQPNFAAWTGFFYKVARADVFVILDDVQYSKRSFQNRNKILAPHGLQWLTVPVRTKGYNGVLIKDIAIDNKNGWRDEHLKALEISYRKAPHFKRYFRLVAGIYDSAHRGLAELNIALMYRIAEDIGIDCGSFVRSSEIAIDAEAKSTERLVQLCEALSADVYVSGNGARKYQDESLFQRRNIGLRYANFTPFVYPQLHAGGFHPRLSILDYLFNCGGERFAHDIRLI